MRRTAVRSAIPLAAAIALLAAAPARAVGPENQVWTVGSFSATGPLFTYDQDLVPPGAQARVHVAYTGEDGTVATLHVTGIEPGETFAVHAHVGSCSTIADTSLGHYQDVAGTGSAFVNDENELWLGFTTNAAGNGAATATVQWQPRVGEAVSLTFHHGGPTRVACIPVAF